MRQEIPKQFLTINDCPVIIYTLAAFQNHPEIDAIAVVCLEGWENVLKAYAKQFGITKLKHIIAGGKNGHESAQNGVYELEKHYKADDIVLIHDGNRPLVSAEIISNCIVTITRYGDCATPVINCTEAMMQTKDGVTSSSTYPRDNLKRGQTPNGFVLKTVCDLYRTATKAGIDDSRGPSLLMMQLGQPIHLFAGSEKNFKLTTIEDIEIFQSLLEAQKPKWLR